MRSFITFVGVFLLVGGVLLAGADNAQAQCQANEFAKVSRGASGDDFGRSVSINGDVAVIGVKYYDGVASASGTAYVYRFDGDSWVYEQQLTASDAAYRDYFGCSVSVSGDYIIIGAYGDDCPGSQSGSAYVFYYNGSSWSQQTKLIPSNGYAGDMFGISVSISGDYVVAGAPYRYSYDSGAAYVYTRSGSTWGTERQINASDAVMNELFGYSVAISGDTVVVGASHDEDNGDDSGSAYVFERSGSDWYEQAKLLPSDGSADDEFGNSVAVRGDSVAVGAPKTTCGTAYVFEKPTGGWENTTETAKLTRSSGTSDDDLGKSVAISSDVVVAGVWGDDVDGSNSGSACVFVKPIGGWPSSMTHTAILLASDAEAGDRLGYSVAISGSTAISGAHKNGVCGSAYVFRGVSDCNGNDELDYCDIDDGTSQDFDDNGIPDECEALLGDLNCDGSVNSLDIDPFVMVLTDTDPYSDYYAQYPECDHLRADVNCDGSINSLDIDPFVDLLTGA